MIDPLKSANLPAPLQGFLERLRIRANQAADRVTGGTPYDIVIIGPTGDFADGGITINTLFLNLYSSIYDDLVLQFTAWGSYQFIKEAEVPEAGTEPPVILVSPNGTRFALAVSDAGALSAVAL